MLLSKFEAPLNQIILRDMSRVVSTEVILIVLPITSSRLKKRASLFDVDRRGSLDMELHLTWVEVPDTLYLRKDKNDKTYRTKEELLLTIFVGDKEGKMVAEQSRSSEAPPLD